MPDKRLGKLYLYRMADETKVKRKGLPKRKSQNIWINSQTEEWRKWEREKPPHHPAVHPFYIMPEQS